MARGSGSRKARGKSHLRVLQKDSTTYASNVNEESAVYGESMSFGSKVISLVHNEDELNHSFADVQFGSGEETLLPNDATFHATNTTAGHIDNVVNDSGSNSTPKLLDLERIEVMCDNVDDLFGVSLTSIKDIDDFTRHMEAGDYEDVLGGKLFDATSDNECSPKGITNDGPTHSVSEWNNATLLGDSLVPIKCLLEKFSADMSNLCHPNVDIGYVPNLDTPIVQLVSIPKSVSYAGAAAALGALSAIPKKVRENFRQL
ncbi:hypothetical protein Tco_1550932 [Tanacetum coccineum]